MGDSWGIGQWAALLLFAVGAAAVIWVIKLIRESRAVVPHDYYTEGLQLLLEGRLIDAAQKLTEAVRHDTGNIDALLKLADIYRQLGKPRRSAQIHVEMSVRSDLTPQSRSTVYRELALDWMAIGLLDKSFGYLDSAMGLDPSNLENYKVQLRLLEQQERWVDAGETLKTLASLTGRNNPERAALYKIQEGELACSNKDEHQGRIIFKEALKLNPKGSEAVLAIAQSYVRDNREKDAIEWLNRYIEENPETSHLGVAMLGRLLFELGRFSEVESVLRGAIEKAPDNKYLALSLVELLTKKGEYQEALDICNRALESSVDVRLELHRLRLLRRKKDDSRFDNYLSEVINRLAPSNQNYYCRQCGGQSEQYQNRCTKCGAWSSYSVERRFARDS